MVLSDEAEAGMLFDAVYSSAYADMDTKSHFISPSGMVLEAGCNETGNEDVQRAKLVQHQASASPLHPLHPSTTLHPCWRRRHEPLTRGGVAAGRDEPRAPRVPA